MRVLDAGVVVELLVGGLDPDRLGDEELVAPHLIDSEVTNVLRKLTLRRLVSDTQATLALNGFAHVILTRYPVYSLLPRMWELRHNLSAYDATYVALAETLGATALLTTDARLAQAHGVLCRVEVI